ncbi:uncharacterized protein LDX57_002047 [Aspergillus melleus]|uniref:uncharacterized protein n=1 Tax=Aspergillus melleus TaxID=138277 RepID=UPI001E8E262F|nr:uncharacterized protein LDX57_002047 [Aspergillus melleus]KAH8424294.1 hypothetical protein LDX57_002047 [Aspergillus melleus]
MPGIMSPPILLCFAIIGMAVSVAAESTTSSDHNRSENVIGNYYNHWIYSDGVYDLTRSDVMNVTEPKRLTNMLGSRKTAIIEPSRTALVMIDMQSDRFSPEEWRFG